MLKSTGVKVEMQIKCENGAVHLIKKKGAKAECNFIAIKNMR